MGCLARALEVLHTLVHLPVTHRDIKLENLLVTGENLIKLCDLGSATTAVHSPNQDWSLNQRTLLEDELAKYSIPMYRAPEMLDTWSNYPINQAMLSLDPRTRPTAGQVMDQLSAIADTHGYQTRGPLP